MRIILIGNGGRKYAGQRYYMTENRAFNGLVRNGHFVWFFSDRDELRTLTPLGFRKTGRQRVNRALVELARNVRPDALIMLNADIIENETLVEMKHLLPALRIAQINVDALFARHNEKRHIERMAVSDAQFFTTGGAVLGRYAGKGSCYFIPNMTDESIDTGRAFECVAPTYDLACVMTIDPRQPDDGALRERLTLEVERRIPDLKTCYYGFSGRPALRGCAYIAAYGESAMALNLSKHIANGNPSTPEERYLYSSDRIAHIMGNGSLAFIADKFGLQALYREDEAVFFSDVDDLTEKVGFYKKNPAARQAMARRGWQKAHGALNERTVMKYVTERLFDQSLSQTYDWPMERYKTVAVNAPTQEREA